MYFNCLGSIRTIVYLEVTEAVTTVFVLAPYVGFLKQSAPSNSGNCSNSLDSSMFIIPFLLHIMDLLRPTAATTLAVSLFLDGPKPCIHYHSLSTVKPFNFLGSWETWLSQSFQTASLLFSAWSQKKSFAVPKERRGATHQQGTSVLPSSIFLVVLLLLLRSGISIITAVSHLQFCLITMKMALMP